MEPILGPYVTEIRDDPAIAAVVSVDENGYRRVRPFEAAAGDHQGSPKDWNPFIVLSILDAPPEPDIPVTFATVLASCYGSTAQNAWEVYRALIAATHRRDPRKKSSGLAIYRTLVISGGEQGRDPGTKQPVVRAVITLIASTVEVAA